MCDDDDDRCPDEDTTYSTVSSTPPCEEEHDEINTMIPADHSHAPWRKSILIPFWTIQLGLELIMIALLSFAVGFLVHYDNNSDDYYNYNISDSDDDRINKVKNM